jgi:hypothetical protein
MVPSNTSMDPMVMAQILGQDGIDKLPFGLKESMQQALEQSQSDTARLTHEQPAVGNATAAIQRRRGSGGSKDQGASPQ